MLNNAHIGQAVGPFLANVDLFDKNQPIGQIINSDNPIVYHLGIQALPGTIVKINGNNIKIGLTGVYELDNEIKIKSLIFTEYAPDTTIVDFVYGGSIVY